MVIKAKTSYYVIIFKRYFEPYRRQTLLFAICAGRLFTMYISLHILERNLSNVKESRHEKSWFRGFRPVPTLTRLDSHRSKLEA